MFGMSSCVAYVVASMVMSPPLFSAHLFEPHQCEQKRCQQNRSKNATICQHFFRSGENSENFSEQFGGAGFRSDQINFIPVAASSSAIACGPLSTLMVV